MLETRRFGVRFGATHDSSQTVTAGPRPEIHETSAGRELRPKCAAPATPHPAEMMGGPESTAEPRNIAACQCVLHSLRQPPLINGRHRRAPPLGSPAALRSRRLGLSATRPRV